MKEPLRAQPENLSGVRERRESRQQSPPPLRRSKLQCTKGCFLMSRVEEALRYSVPPAVLGRSDSHKEQRRIHFCPE